MNNAARIKYFDSLEIPVQMDDKAILEATFRKGKKTIGIRAPLNNIALSIVNVLGNPIMTSSIKDEDEILEYTTDPYLLHERLEKHVNLVIDGGFGNNTATTVVDCTTEDPIIVRQGLGFINELL